MEMCRVEVTQPEAGDLFMETIIGCEAVLIEQRSDVVLAEILELKPISSEEIVVSLHGSTTCQCNLLEIIASKPLHILHQVNKKN